MCSFFFCWNNLTYLLSRFLSLDETCPLKIDPIIGPIGSDSGRIGFRPDLFGSNLDRIKLIYSGRTISDRTEIRIMFSIIIGLGCFSNRTVVDRIVHCLTFIMYGVVTPLVSWFLWLWAFVMYVWNHHSSYFLKIYITNLHSQNLCQRVLVIIVFLNESISGTSNQTLIEANNFLLLWDRATFGSDWLGSGKIISDHSNFGWVSDQDYFRSDSDRTRSFWIRTKIRTVWFGPRSDHGSNISYRIFRSWPILSDLREGRRRTKEITPRKL